MSAHSVAGFSSAIPVQAIPSGRVSARALLDAAIADAVFASLDPRLTVFSTEDEASFAQTQSKMRGLPDDPFAAGTGLVFGVRKSGRGDHKAAATFSISLVQDGRVLGYVTLNVSLYLDPLRRSRRQDSLAIDIAFVFVDRTRRGEGYGSALADATCEVCLSACAMIAKDLAADIASHLEVRVSSEAMSENGLAFCRAALCRIQRAAPSYQGPVTMAVENAIVDMTQGMPDAE